MDFERRKIEKRHFNKIILEYDIIGDINIVKCQQIANSLAASIPVQLLTERRIEITCSKALVQPSPKRNYSQVELPPREMTVSVLGRKK